MLSYIFIDILTSFSSLKQYLCSVIQKNECLTLKNDYYGRIIMLDY